MAPKLDDTLNHVEKGVPHSIENGQYTSNINVDFTGMPIRTLIKWALKAMIIRSRPVKFNAMGAAFQQTRGKTFSWVELVNKGAAEVQASVDALSPADQLAFYERKMAELQAKAESSETPETETE